MFGDTTLWRSSFVKGPRSKDIKHEQSNVIHFRPYGTVKRRKPAAKLKKFLRSSLPK